MEKLNNIHPGEILLEEFLSPFNISAYKLAKDIDIPQTRVSEIIKGKRRITADTALRLSKYFGNSAKFWLGLQDDYDIEEEKRYRGHVTDTIKTLQETVQKFQETVIKHGGATNKKQASVNRNVKSAVAHSKGQFPAKGATHSKGQSPAKVTAHPKSKSLTRVGK